MTKPLREHAHPRLAQAISSYHLRNELQPRGPHAPHHQAPEAEAHPQEGREVCPEEPRPFESRHSAEEEGLSHPGSRAAAHQTSRCFSDSASNNFFSLSNSSAILETGLLSVLLSPYGCKSPFKGIWFCLSQNQLTPSFFYTTEVTSPPADPQETDSSSYEAVLRRPVAYSWVQLTRTESQVWFI